MILRKNAVYKVEGVRQRVVSILSARLVLFNIDDPEKSLPYLYCKDTFIDLLNEEIITQVDDPFDHLALKPVEPVSKAEIKRDERFKVIRALVQHDRFYDSDIRGKLVAEAEEKFGRGEKFIYKWFRRCFEGLYLSKATANGLGIWDIINSLDITEEYFYDFLNEKARIDMALAKKLDV